MESVSRGVILKQNDFYSVIGVAPTDGGMMSPTRSIDNGEKPKSAPVKEGPSETEKALKKAETEVRKFREEQNAALEAERLDCERECQELLAKAKEEAAEIVAKADEDSRVLRESTVQECEELRKKAEESGYADGFAKGEKPGYDEGFQKGKDECRDVLAEVNAVLARIPEEKEKIFRDYESKLFDLIFTVSNKVTAGSLNQKDKAVISRMLKETAKNFRGSSFIKVSLSKLDVEESVNVDIDDLSRIFGENQHVEFEILKDAPRGTLILDNGSEITDAGISTQLKMIENLGKGKFRNVPDPEMFGGRGAVPTGDLPVPPHDLPITPTDLSVPTAQLKVAPAELEVAPSDSSVHPDGLTVPSADSGGEVAGSEEEQQLTFEEG